MILFARRCRYSDNSGFGQTPSVKPHPCSWSNCTTCVHWCATEWYRGVVSWVETKSTEQLAAILYLLCLLFDRFHEQCTWPDFIVVMYLTAAAAASKCYVVVWTVCVLRCFVDRRRDRDYEDNRSPHYAGVKRETLLNGVSIPLYVFKLQARSPLCVVCHDAPISS